MPAWLTAALESLKQGALMGAGASFFGASAFPQGGSGFSSPGTGLVPSAADIGRFDFTTGRFIGKRRRRRRRALTASDKADIAFIAGILGKPAGKDIAAIIAARTG